MTQLVVTKALLDHASAWSGRVQGAWMSWVLLPAHLGRGGHLDNVLA